MRRVLTAGLGLIVAGTVFLLLATGCSSAPQQAVRQVGLNAKSSDSGLDKGIVGLKAEPLVRDGYSISLVGARLDKSTGDAIKDSLRVGTGLKTEFVDGGMSRGFDIGFANSSNKEVSKRDAYVSLYMKYALPAGTSARDSVVPTSKYSAVDDRGEDVIVVSLSNKDKYIDVANPYGVILLKTYFDAHSVRLDIDGTPYEVNLDALKKLQR